jgi:hypothetical protein
MKKRIFWNRKTVAMVAVSALLVPAMLSYLYLEFLTALHGREFDNAVTVDDVIDQTGAMVVPPEFTKVINYSNTKAEVLWIHFTRHNDPGHTWFEFRPIFIKFIRGQSEYGKKKWIVDTWNEPR